MVGVRWANGGRTVGERWAYGGRTVGVRCPEQGAPMHFQIHLEQLGIMIVIHIILYYLISFLENFIFRILRYFHNIL